MSSPPQRGAKVAARAKDLTVSSTYGKRQLGRGVVENGVSGMDEWRTKSGTLNPSLLTSTGTLPPLVPSPSGSVSLAASLSLSCLMPPPREVIAKRRAADATDGQTAWQPWTLAEQASQQAALEASELEAFHPRLSGDGALALTLRCSPDEVARGLRETFGSFRERNVAFEAMDTKMPLGERLRQSPNEGSVSPIGQSKTVSLGARTEASGFGAEPFWLHGNKMLQPKVRKPRSHNSQSNARSVAAELTRQRSNIIRRQMLIENPEYMQSELLELRRGKVRLRNTVNRCTDDELFENRSFYTPYAMAIRQRSEIKEEERRQRSELKKQLEDAKMPWQPKDILSYQFEHSSELSSTANPSTAVEGKRSAAPAVTRGQTDSNSPERQQSGMDDPRRRKRRGEPEATSIALEVRALQQQIEGSHKKLQEGSAAEASKVRVASKNSASNL